MPANVLESLWKGLAPSALRFGWRWGILGLFRALAWAEARSGFQTGFLWRAATWRGRRWDRLHCSLQVGGPEWLLSCDSSLEHPEYFRSGEVDSSS